MEVIRYKGKEAAPRSSSGPRKIERRTLGKQANTPAV